MSRLREALRRRALARVKDAAPEVSVHANTDLVADGDRPCPICGSTMLMSARDSIVIDVCEEHGVWLDRGELERILHSERGKARSGKWDAVKRAKKEGRIEGARYGFWSLVLD